MKCLINYFLSSFCSPLLKHSGRIDRKRKKSSVLANQILTLTERLKELRAKAISTADSIYLKNFMENELL